MSFSDELLRIASEIGFNLLIVVRPKKDMCNAVPAEHIFWNTKMITIGSLLSADTFSAVKLKAVKLKTRNTV